MFNGSVTLAFVVPLSVTLTEQDFASLRVLHNESGQLIDVTAVSPPPSFATRTV